MSSYFDFNTAQPQQGGDLIPAKTFARVVSTVRPGGHGEGGWLTKAQSGFEYLNFEFTISSAPYAKRKIFQNAGVAGVTEGHEKAAEITRSMLRGILESARSIGPKDETDKARRARVIQSFGDFVELEFAVEIGIEKGKDGYDDKNKITRVLTPDHKHYRQVMAGETIAPGATAGSSPNPQVPAYQAAAAAPVVHNSPIPAWAR
jgi:hypothetical protein